MKKFGKILIAVCAAVLVICSVFTFTACNASSDKDGAYSPAEDGSSNGGDGLNSIVITEDRLVVYTVDMDMTVEDLTKTVKTVRAKLKEVGGWEKNMSVDGYDDSQYASFVLRVPTEKLDEFLNAIEEGNKVGSKSIRGVDVTEEYIGIEAQKRALEVEKEMWQKILDEESPSLSTKREILARLNEIAVQMDKYTAQMTDYKKQVEYSTVNLSIHKNNSGAKESFWDRLGRVLSGSGSSLGSVFGWILTIIVAILPYLGVIAAIFGLYVLIKFIVCKIRKVPFTLFAKARERAKARKEMKRRMAEAYEKRERKRNGKKEEKTEEKPKEIETLIETRETAPETKESAGEEKKGEDKPEETDKNDNE